MRPLADTLNLIWWRTIVPLRLKARGVTFGQNTSFTGSPIITMENNSRIHIGDRCSLISTAKHTALGVTQPVILRTLRPNAIIDIGSDTGISGAVICSSIEIRIGRECLIGANCMIFDTDFHPIDPNNRRYERNPERINCLPVCIEDNVFIGTNSIITKGITIGKNSVIGAGSVVTTDIPANVIAAGNPARTIRSI